jgi:hypothetical protein
MGPLLPRSFWTPSQRTARRQREPARWWRSADDSPALGARIRLTGGGLTVTDGPFTETRELVGGYSVYEVKSKHEAIEWTYRFMRLFAKHWPAGECEAEIRQIFEAPEFD